MITLDYQKQSRKENNGLKTKTWCAKPIKEVKDYRFLDTLLERTIEIVSTEKEISRPEIPHIPKNIAPSNVPSKEDVIQKQKTRYRI